MIPKIIHFCWLSGEPYPPLIEHCINSWREKLPGYQFVLWDKAKADGIASEWVQEAYRNRKYAFAADYIRCYALYHFGGIYLDADVEVLKNMDELLVCKSFLGYDSTGALEAAIIGAEPRCPWIGCALEYYEGRHFVRPDGKFDVRPIPGMIYEKLHQLFDFKDRPDRVQELPEITLFPSVYFSPKNYQTLKISISSGTYTVHHFDGKWIDATLKHRIKKAFHKILSCGLGESGHNKMVSLIRAIKRMSYYE